MSPPSHGGRPEPLLTRDFGLLTGAHFLNAVAWSSMMLLPLYLDALGATRAELGAIIATAGVGGLLVRPAVGWALDVVGRRAVLMVGGLIVAASTASLGAVDDLGALVYLQRFAFGVGVGVAFTAFFTFAADIVPASRRTEGIALFGVSGLLPLALNPFVGDLGFAPLDLRIFYPIAGAIVLASVGVVALVREPPREADRAPFRLSAAITALADRRLRPVWVATGVFSMIAAVFMAYSTVTAEAAGVARPADLWLTYALGAVTVRLFGSRLPDRLGPSRFIPPALAFYVFGLLGCAFATSSEAFLAAGLCAGVGHGWCFPILIGQVVTRSPRALHGSAVAMYTAIWVVAELAMTPLFGLIGDLASDTALFVTAAAAAVAGTAWWRALETRYAATPR